MDIEILRKFCLSFPQVTEDVKWENNLCFCVGGKIFCIAYLELPNNFSFKATDEEFDELSQKIGFMPAPYLARAKWVTVTDSSALSRKELKNYLQQSYDMIKAKISRKKKEELGLE